MRVTRVKDDGELEDIFSWEITVGDQLMIRQVQEMPADLVFLSSHLQNEDKKSAYCHIQTSSLDGEKTLKKRETP